MLMVVGEKKFMRRTAPRVLIALRSLAMALRIVSEPAHKKCRIPPERASLVVRSRLRTHTGGAALPIAQSDPQHRPTSVAAKAAQCARHASILHPLLQNRESEPT